MHQTDILKITLLSHFLSKHHIVWSFTYYYTYTNILYLDLTYDTGYRSRIRQFCATEI